jgi:hypothetical protein
MKLPTLCFALGIVFTAAADTVPSSLQKSLTFHASFDHGPDADFGHGDRRLFHAPSMSKPRTDTPGLPANGVVSIAKGEGRTGDALRFHRKSTELVFFHGEKNFPHTKSNWSGTVSFWLRLNPDADLEPGFCDPIQITSKEWNDAAFWVDFSKDERPRHFRFGAFADRSVWDPDKRDYDALPANERPVIPVTAPSFSRDRWTHVVLTFAQFNTGKKDGTFSLYLDGKAQGTVTGWQQTLSWEPEKAIAMLGIGYTGLFDELSFFNRALTAEEVAALFALPNFGPGVVSAEESRTTKGLAAQYPGDAGIAKDPAVLFHEDFETGLPGERWDEVKTRGKSAVPAVQQEKAAAIARGTCSARVMLGKDGFSDISLYKNLAPGREELFMRHYVRYGKDYGYHGHGGSGFMADAGKGEFKGAGKAPDGDKFFWATLEPIGGRGRWQAPGALIFYAYWWKMKPDGRGNHWGNWFEPEPVHIPVPETWLCVEWRVKINTPAQDDGELDCWIDGKKCGEFRAINWRETESLKLNKAWLTLWLEADNYDQSGGGTTRTVWYDDVVVATQYIGPVGGR